jgi:hypothetical protein
MAKATKDLRLVVPEYVHDVLDTEAAGTHDDIHAIARQVLERWARERHRVHKLYAKRLRSKGLQMELDGMDAEDDGATAGRSP